MKKIFDPSFFLWVVSGFYLPPWGVKRRNDILGPKEAREWGREVPDPPATRNLPPRAWGGGGESKPASGGGGVQVDNFESGISQRCVERGGTVGKLIQN